MNKLTARFPLLCASVLASMLAACVSVPQQFQGEYTPLTPAQVTPADIGVPIRWGGVVLATQPEDDRTCFEILSKPLAKSMRPGSSDQTLGRFIACRSGFLDPEVFARGREVTLTGTLVELEQRKVGEFDYLYPIVQAGFITMWPERVEVLVPDYDPFYRPWYWSPYYHHYPYGPAPMRRSIDKGPRVDVPPASDSGGGRD